MDPQRGYASWIGVESSNVEAVLWFIDNNGNGVLAVRYKARGRSPATVYHYTKRARGGTGEEVMRAFLDAPSKGKFRHKYLTPENGYLVEGPMY